MQNTTRMVNHIVEIVAGFENRITNIENEIDNLTADLNAKQDIIAKPFDKADELNEKRTRFNEVMELLAPKNEQQHGNDSEDVQYQSRDYWENYGYSSHEEFLEAVESGALIMDNEGNLIEKTQNQQRDNSLSDREILELAANEIKIEDLTDGEKDALQIYKDRLTKLEDLQKARTEQGGLYREQQFGEKVDEILKYIKIKPLTLTLRYSIYSE